MQPRSSLSAAAQSLGISQHQLLTAGTTYAYVAFWIFTSAFVILYNKWILTVWGFAFPITLTMWHMAFCTVVSFALVRSGTVQSVNMTRQMYLSSVVPIGALFSGTLWFGNASYTYLSVSFIQMLKALMPAAVYTCSLVWGVEKRKTETMYIMGVISLGVAIASYGELAFVLTGVLFQLASIATESNRIVLVQILLQNKGIKLNPITSMYYISPCCLLFLSVPWLALEYPRLRAAGVIGGAGAVASGMTTSSEAAFGGRGAGAPVGTTNWLDAKGINIFITNAAAAFTLNCAVFLLIGKSSALTMNIAGVVKDWLLIYLSWVLFAGPITPLNLFGYSIAFSAVCYYNYLKLRGMTDENAKKQGAAGGGADGGKDAEMQAPTGIAGAGEDAATGRSPRGDHCEDESRRA